jgi:uncharacterized SAM-binding protein YcdF (DUF218 family)
VRRAGSSRLKYWTIALGLIAAVVLTHAVWLRALGAALIHDDGAARAEIAVVLAGDPWGNRILKAAELVRDGYVPAVLVSGPSYYEIPESSLAIELAVRHGYPRTWFIGLPLSALSTRQEARDILGELRRRNVHSFILVTSDYHTARAGRIYRATERQMGGGPEFRTVAAPDRYFQSKSWWRSRQGLKTGFMEWSKTLATAVGI